MQTQLNTRHPGCTPAVRSGASARFSTALAAVAILALVFGLAGCSVGSEGLPSGLPGLTGGAGNLQIATLSMPDGIDGRTYNRVIMITGGTAPYICTNTTPMPTGLALSTNGNTCVVSGTPTASGPAPFTIQVTDSSLPPVHKSVGYSTYNVRPEYAITAVPAMPDGVQGRTYGAPLTSPAAMTSVSSTVGNAPLTVCTITGTGGNTITGAITGMSNCAANATAAGMTSPGAFAAVTFTVTDSPITDPANAATIIVPSKTFMMSTAWTVHPPLTNTPNLGVNPAPDAVQGRTYGSPAKTDLSFAAAGGLPGQAINVSSGAPPAGIGCTPSGLVLTCNSGGAVVSGTTQAFVVTATDPGNSAVPAGNVPVNVTLKVDGPLTVAAFGVGNVTESRAITTPVVVSVTGGLQPSVVCSLSGGPAGITVATTAPTCTISGTPAAGTSGASPYAAFTLNATDAGDATTPPPAPVASASTALVDNPPLKLNGGAAIVFPANTVNHAYGPFNIPITGGNGPYTCTDLGANLPASMTVTASVSNCVVSGTPSSTVTNKPITIQVSDTASSSTAAGMTSQTGNLTINAGVSLAPFVLPTDDATVAYPTQNITISNGTPPYTCVFSAPSANPGGLSVTAVGNVCRVTGASPTAFPTAMVTIMVSDSASPTADTTTGSSNLTINPAPTITPFAFPNGEVTIPYAGLTITIMGGTGPFTCTFSAPSASPGGLTIAAAGSTCVIPTAAPTVAFPTANATVQVKDSFGLTTTSTASLTIFGQLTISSTILGNGVDNRNFSQMISFANGSGGYACSSTGLPGTLAVGVSGMNCSVTGTAPLGVFGPAPVTVTVMDSLGASATDSASTTFQIFAALAITTTQAQVPNGLLNNPYKGVTFTATGGIGAQTWVAPGASTPPCPVSGATTDLAGLTLSAGGVLSGTPNAASTSANFFKPTICVFDVGSASTAAGFATMGYTFDVMNNFAYAADTGSQSIEVINTSTNASVTSFPTAGFIAPGTPNGVAITSDGRFAIVTQDASDAIDVLDTITNLPDFALPIGQVLLPSGTSCGTPAGVAVDAKFVYIACDSTAGTNVEEVLVLSEPALVTGTVTVVAQIPTGAGTIPDSIAFKTDDSRAYVTLNGNNQMMIIDNTLATPAPIPASQGVNPTGVFDLPATTDSPREIAVVPNAAKVYAYLAKQTSNLGAIAFVSPSNTTCVTASGTTPSTLACPLAASTTSGDTVIVMVAIRTAASTVTSVTDTGGSTYTQIPGCVKNNTVRIECWATAPGASIGSATVTANLAAGSNFTMTVVEYSGVVAFGNVTAATAAAANPSISVNTQDTNDFCVAGFAGQGTGTFAALTGNLRTSGVTAGNAPPNSKEVGGAAVDRAIAAPGACTTSVTNADTTWAMAAVELRIPAGVDVVDVTADPSGVGTAMLTPVTTIFEGSASGPFGLAAVPGTFARVYVTLSSANQYDVLNNSVATPVEVAGVSLPYNTPDPTAAGSGSPVGVAIPPLGTVPATGLPVFITLSATNAVAVVNDAPALSPANAKNTSFATSGFTPQRIAAIPVPQ